MLVDKPVLKIDWSTYAAAKFACENWHYSKTIPSAKRVFVGAWEGDAFVGVVIFSTGAAPQSHLPYNLSRNQVCELTRVALRAHSTPVTRIISIAIKFLRKQSPGLRLLISYADPEQGHHGGIYQGGGWLYAGVTNPCEHFEIVSSGRRVHSKTLRGGKRGYATQLKASGHIVAVKSWKHKYLMPLDAEMRKQIAPLAKPYPKRAGSDTSDTPCSQHGKGGSTPTPALYPSNGPDNG